MNQNLKAFLDMIAWSEIGPTMLACSDNGYNVLVGSTPDKMLLFSDYSTHPKIHNVACNSDAAGRYQEMGKFWGQYKLQLNLPDFSPASQDRWAIQLIKECRAFDDVLTGHFDTAVAKCSSRWASLPGNHYGQRQHAVISLRESYANAGGTFA